MPFVESWISTSDLMAAWLLTYLVHSTLLLGAVWGVTRWLGSRQLALQEGLWRMALVGGLATATLQLSLGWVSSPSPAEGGAVVAARVELGSPVEGSPSLRSPATTPARTGSLPPAEAAWWTAPPARAALTALWLVGAVALGLRLLRSKRRLAFLLRRRRSLRRGRLYELFRSLVRPLTAADRMRLTSSTELEVPIARGLRDGEVCLPRRFESDLPAEQQDTVLAHEVAHLARRDPAWLLLYRLVEAALFPQPLNRVAVRCLEEIAECRCDDWAVERTGRPLDLARCLTRVADWSLHGRAPLTAPTLAARGSHLQRRVRRLLDRPGLPLEGSAPRWLPAAAAIALLATTLLVPGVAPLGATVAPAPAPPETEPARPAEPADEVTVAPAAPEAPEALSSAPPAAPEATSPPTTSPVAPEPVVAPRPLSVAGAEPTPPVPSPPPAVWVAPAIPSAPPGEPAVAPDPSLLGAPARRSSRAPLPDLPARVMPRSVFPASPESFPRPGRRAPAARPMPVPGSLPDGPPPSLAPPAVPAAPPLPTPAPAPRPDLEVPVAPVGEALPKSRRLRFGPRPRAFVAPSAPAPDGVPPRATVAPAPVPGAAAEALSDAPGPTDRVVRPTPPLVGLGGLGTPPPVIAAGVGPSAEGERARSDDEERSRELRRAREEERARKMMEALGAREMVEELQAREMAGGPRTPEMADLLRARELVEELQAREMAEGPRTRETAADLLRAREMVGELQSREVARREALREVELEREKGRLSERRALSGERSVESRRLEIRVEDEIEVLRRRVEELERRLEELSAGDPDEVGEDGEADAALGRERDELRARLSAQEAELRRLTTRQGTR